MRAINSFCITIMLLGSGLATSMLLSLVPLEIWLYVFVSCIIAVVFGSLWRLVYTMMEWPDGGLNVNESGKRPAAATERKQNAV